MMNVRKMTTSRTGIVQKMRLMMNFTMVVLYPRRQEGERGRGCMAPSAFEERSCYSVTTTFLRSVWLSRLTENVSFTFSRSRFE